MRIEEISLVVALLFVFGIMVVCLIQKKVISIKLLYTLWSLLTLTIIFPTGVLLYYQVTQRYEFTYVYEHISSSLPLCYKISALWAGQQGSFLLWGCILAVLGYFVIKLVKQHSYRVMGIYSGITLLIVMLSFITKPFAIGHEAVEGLGLSIALQDPWMVVHPPLVFIGYTGMGILFSMMADTEFKEKTLRFWCSFSYLFLGLGILTGSVWAYRSLGWGGFWAWDAIENIALVPWIILCAYLHGNVKFTKTVCVIPFSIAALGTFLTRSGVLKDSSVHGYATSNANYGFILLIGVLIAVLLLLGILVYKKKIRISKIDGKNKLQVFRVTSYLYAGILLIGTLVDILGIIATTHSFYNVITGGYAILISLELIGYHKEVATKQYLSSFVVNTLVTIVASIVYEGSVTAVILLLWVVMLPISIFLVTIKKSSKEKVFISHLLVSFFMVGVVMASGFSQEKLEICKVQKEEFIFQGKTFSKEIAAEHKTLMVHDFSGDYIITDAKESASGELLIFYERKPLIYLFWIGGFGILGFGFKRGRSLTSIDLRGVREAGY